MQTKTELRKSLKQQRAKLTPDIRAAKARKIVVACMDLIDWDTVKQIHCFESLPDEVDTAGLIRSAQLREVEVTIPEQKSSRPTPEEMAKSYDVIIVPMLGFDTSLQRLGYGGGYYDRLLATQPGAQKIGVCFELGELPDRLPTEEHDVPLDVIVTEDRVWRA